MFQKINLLSLDATVPIRASNYAKQSLFSDYEVPDEALHAFHSDFTLTGDIRVLLPRPVSADTKEKLLYIQSFTLIHADSRYYTKRQDYDSCLLLYTYRGNGLLKYEGNTYELNAGDGFLIDCRKPHEYYTVSNEWYHGDLHFNGPNKTRILEAFTKEGCVKFSLSSQDKYQKRLEDLLYDYCNVSKHKDLYIDSQLNDLVFFILHEMESKSESKIPETIRYLTRYMESNHTNPLTLDHLSNFANMSKYHLCREFKKYTGYSPNDYLIELRLEHAKLLLTHTTLPACKIGAMVGIPNDVNFLRLFKKKNGVTPGEYRKNYFL
ncbi:MAG: helix-turn-helix domain-containing protein [Dorea sp.]